MKTLSTPPYKPVTIGIVGLNFGRHIVEQLCQTPANPWCRLVGVCDLDEEKAKRIASERGIRMYTGLDAMLADPALEAVGLFTGPVGRAKLIRRIIQAGKHVMTTKPFERDPAAALDILNEAKQLGRVVHLNSPGPRLPEDLKQILKWQETLKLGRPIACRTEVWASYREPADGTWYDDPEACPVAPVFRLGIYLINDMLRLLGEVQSVQVAHSRLFTGRPTADNAQLSLRFKNGALGNIFASFCIDDGQYYSNGMVLNYENGTVYRNMEPRDYGQTHKSTRLSVVAKTGDRETVIEKFETTEGSGGYQWQAFSEAVHGGGGDTIAPAQIVEGIKVISAMARAERSGNAEPVC